MLADTFRSHLKEDVKLVQDGERGAKEQLGAVEGAWLVKALLMIKRSVFPEQASAREPGLNQGDDLKKLKPSKKT